MKLSDNFGQSIEFELPSACKQIAVNCSGGADSAILLYMVADYIKTNNMVDTKLSVLTCSNDRKHRWNGRKAADVVNYIIDRLDWNQFDIHYVYYRDLQAETYFHEVETKLFEDNRTDMIVSGITANPTCEAVIKNRKGMYIDLATSGLPERSVPNQPVMTSNKFSGQFYTPFVNVDKRFVAAMYTHYNVADMVDLTRSCEAIPEPGTKYNATFENSPCGNCWWCLERKWAFGKF